MLRRGKSAEIRYFGDLDPTGLSIPAAAAEEAAKDDDLPAVLPAVGLYDALLHGPRISGSVSYLSLDFAGFGVDVAVSVAPAVTAWLGVLSAFFVFVGSVALPNCSAQ